MKETLSRRGFMSAAAAGTGAALFGRTVMGQTATDRKADGRTAYPPVKIHRVYVGRQRAAWPKPAFKPEDEVPVFERKLAELKARMGDVELVGGELVQTAEEAAKLIPKLKEADGVLLIHLALGVLPILQQIVDAGRPTAFFSQPFSGHEWMFVQQWQNAGKKVALFATRDLNELADAVNIVAVPARMARSRLVVVGRPAGTPPAIVPERVKEKLGVEVIPVSVEEVIEAHKSVDPKLAEAEAEQIWIKQARKIIEPTREEIIKSSKMFLAMKAILTANRAQAITINCLGGIPIDILGYPCLGFTRLLDMGLVGACEADMDSSLTMLVFTYAFGVPGFISDPLFDTSKNAVIHAHCTAPTRMDGPAGERAPFVIRTHTDDDKGAALEVEMRLGQVITCAKLVNLDTMIASTGKIIEIPDFDDRGCRTQITTEVANAAAMLANWGAGLVDGWVPQLHRVVFYGDRLAGVRQLAPLMGFKVIEGM